MPQLVTFCTDVASWNVTASGGAPEVGDGVMLTSGAACADTLVVALCGAAPCADSTVRRG